VEVKLYAFLTQLHAPATLPPGKRPPVPTGHEGAGPMNSSKRGTKEKIILASTGNRTPVVQPVA